MIAAPVTLKRPKHARTIVFQGIGWCRRWAGGRRIQEATECNKALLLLALGEPSQALAVASSVPRVRLHDYAAAYKAIALSRLGQKAEAISVLDTAAHGLGVTHIITAAREHIGTAASFHLMPAVAAEEDLLKNLTAAIAGFRLMNPDDQARVLSTSPSALEAVVVDYIRAATDSVVSLVPMMKGVQIDAIEDDLTAFIQHILAARVQMLGWSVTDQSKGGFTAKGNAGERDLLLMWGNTVLALIEAVVCDRPMSQDAMKANLESHFQKLLGYGNPQLFFHLTYAYLDDPASLMTELEKIAEETAPPGFVFKGRNPIPQTDSRPTGFAAQYVGDFAEVKVIFLVLNLGQSRQRTAAKRAAETKTRRVPGLKGSIANGL